MTASLRYARLGARGVVSLPAFILMFAFVGFAGIARAAGFDVWQTMFMVFTIWALPAHLIFVDGVAAGASALAIAAGVSLSSMRLMPMVAGLVPDLRGARTPLWVMFVASHFIAITSYVYTLEHLDEVPREHRMSFYLGLAIPLTATVTGVAGLAHALAAAVPPMVAAAIYFMTPPYFAMSLIKTSRFTGRVALGLGFVIGPLVGLLLPGAGALAAGIGGGLLAYLVGRWRGK